MKVELWDNQKDYRKAGCWVAKKALLVVAEMVLIKAVELAYSLVDSKAE